MIKILIILSTLLFVACYTQNTGNYQASGLYVGLGSNFLMNEGNTMTGIVQNELLSMPLPNQSGSSSSAKYSFSNFKLALSLQDIFYNELDMGIFQIGWQTVTFQLQWNYHICAKNTVINPCEDGTITVFVTSGQSISVASNVMVTLNTTTTNILATTTEFAFSQGALQVNVHCSNKICVIPVDTIASEVSQQFISTAQTAITAAINKQIPTVEALFTPIQQLPYTFPNGDKLWINLEGNLVEQSNPQANMPTITGEFNGGFILEMPDNTFVYPPQTPSYIPTAEQLESFTSDYCISISGFFIESLCYASLYTLFPTTINPDQVPADSPVHLNTSDPFFTGVAPGIAGYVNQGIQVNVYSPVTPVVTINSTGILLTNFEISADFIVLDQDDPITVFTVVFTIDAEIFTNIYAVNSYTFSLNSTILSMTPNATIASSVIGPVDASGFVQLMQMLQSVIKIPSFVYAVPSKYLASDLSLSFSNQLLQITLDLADNDSMEMIEQPSPKQQGPSIHINNKKSNFNLN